MPFSASALFNSQARSGWASAITRPSSTLRLGTQPRCERIAIALSGSGTRMEI